MLVDCLPSVDVNVRLFQTEEEPPEDMVDGDVATSPTPPAFDDPFIISIEFDVPTRK